MLCEPVARWRTRRAAGERGRELAALAQQPHRLDPALGGGLAEVQLLEEVLPSRGMVEGPAHLAVEDVEVLGPYGPVPSPTAGWPYLPILASRPAFTAGHSSPSTLK